MSNIFYKFNIIGMYGIKMVNNGDNLGVGIQKGRDDVMNKALKVALTYLMIFAAVLMITALVITAMMTSASADVPTVLAKAQSSNCYWLRTYNEHIAVFDDGITVNPVVETTIAVEGLRAVDRAQLEYGIKAQTYEDVLKLLEDFSS